MNYRTKINLLKLIEVTDAKELDRGYLGHCPGHQDKQSSYSFEMKDGIFLHHCFAGCDQDVLWTKLNDIGIVEKRDKMSHWEKLLAESVPSSALEAFVARKYFENRGLSSENIPKSIRFLQRCAYLEDKVKIGEFPAILSLISKRGAGVAVHRTYLIQDGKKAAVTSPKKILGTSAGGHILLGKIDERMAVTEGLETGLAIYQSTGLSVLVAISASGMKNLETPQGVKILEIFADRDLSEAGELAAKALAAKAIALGLSVKIHLPQAEIPVGNKGVDWLDVLNLDGKHAILNALDVTSVYEQATPGQKPQSPLNTLSWNPLKAIVFEEAAQPDLAKCSLPFVLDRYVFSQAKEKSVAPDFIFAPLLVALAGTAGRTFSIKPLKGTEWQLYSVLWGMIVGKPGSKKTASLESGMRFVTEIETDYRKEFQKELAKSIGEIKKTEHKIKQANKKIEKNGADYDAIMAEIESLEKYILDLTPEQNRLVIQNATVEKIIQIHAKNHNGLIANLDEIAGFLISLRQEMKSVERGFWLECWNGNGSYTVDRVSRPGEHVDGLCISIMGGTQPGKLSPMIKGSMDGGSEDDGLVQRFQVLISSIRHPKLIKGAHASDNEAIMLMRAFVNALHFQQTKGSVQFYFSDQAQDVFENWHNNLLNNLQDNPSDWEALDAHFAKYTSFAPKIALLFHLANCFDDTAQRNPQFFAPNGVEWKPEISLSTLKQALGVIEFFKEHANRVYSVLTKRTELAAKSLSERILRGLVTDGQSVRSLKQKHWSYLTNQGEIEEALEILEQHGWLFLEVLKPPTGRPKTVIRLNPGLDAMRAKK